MTKQTKTQSAAVSGWEDEGGAAPSASQTGAEKSQQQSDTRVADEQRLDASHDSGIRGEHRYPDAHQTPLERQGRDERDNLKKRLRG